MDETRIFTRTGDRLTLVTIPARPTPLRDLAAIRVCFVCACGATAAQDVLLDTPAKKERLPLTWPTGWTVRPSGFCCPACADQASPSSG